MSGNNGHLNGSSGSPGKQGRNRGGTPPPEHRFNPGQSGNPSGRPKGRSITQTLRKIIGPEDSDKAREIAEAVLEGAIKSARDGDPRMLRELLDRVEGPIKQQVETELHQLVYDIKMPGTEDMSIDRR